MPATDPLVRLLGVIQPALSLYLADSGLGSYPGGADIRSALAELAADQRRLLERGGEVLVDREQVPPRPHYPLSYTAVHDLDLDALLAPPATTPRPWISSARRRRRPAGT
jgi:hypothetical protein